MLDEAALIIENVADTALTDFQFPEKVPQTETNLDNAHTSISPRAGEAQRHIRFRLTALIPQVFMARFRRRTTSQRF